MVEIEQFFEDYEVGAERITAARTITETDIVTVSYTHLTLPTTPYV